MFFNRRKKKKSKKGAAEAETHEPVYFEDEAEDVAAAGADGASEGAPVSDDADGEVAASVEEEVLEIEFDEDDIECYLVDEDDNEIGFVLIDEDGNEVEYYYADEGEDAEEPEAPASTAKPSKKTSGKKNASLAYRAGAAAAGAAAAGKVAAEAGVEKAKQGVETARGWADKFDPNDDGEYDLGITREGVAETTDDMNAIYHEGVETIAELKSAFDDIKEGMNFDGLFGKKK